MWNVTTLGPKSTGVPLAIFTYQLEDGQPIIKVGRKPADYRTGNLITISIADVPEVLANNAQLTDREIELAKAWVMLNKELLLQFWQSETMDSIELLENVKSL